MKHSSSINSLSNTQRLSIYYGVLYTGYGVFIPYMPLWFKSQGLNGSQIGLIFALPLLLRAVTSPLIGMGFERFKLFRTPLIILGLVALISEIFLMLSPGFSVFRFGAIVLFWGIVSTAISAMSPLTDSMSLHLSRAPDYRFSTPRAIGSAAFVATTIIVGYGLKLTSVDLIIYIILCVTLFCAILAHLILPPIAVLEHKPVVVDAMAQASSQASSQASPKVTGFKRVLTLMGDARFVWLVIGLGALQSAHSFYYSFSTIIWKSQGIGEGVCGLLWGLGVGAEIIFIAWGQGWRRRFGVKKMLIIAGIFSVVRWGLMMFTPTLWLLWPLQIFHAMTFAATYMAGIEMIQSLSPKGYEGLGQLLSSAYGSGLLMGIATLASGGLYDQYGVLGYGLMAVISVFGLCVAFWLSRQDLRAKSG